MDEYIKREDAIKHLRGACIAKYPLSFSYGIFASADEIGKLPTADVVPKSEVEASENEIERLKYILNNYALQYGTVTDKQKVIDEAKTEVAREIFEEIEKHILENCCVTDDDVDGIWKHIAELKKKYTEGKQNESFR